MSEPIPYGQGTSESGGCDDCLQVPSRHCCLWNEPEADPTKACMYRSLAKDGRHRAEVRAICADAALIDYSGASWDEWITLGLVAEQAAQIGRNERDQ